MWYLLTVLTAYERYAYFREWGDHGLIPGSKTSFHLLKAGDHNHTTWSGYLPAVPEDFWQSAGWHRLELEDAMLTTKKNGRPQDIV